MTLPSDLACATVIHAVILITFGHLESALVQVMLIVNVYKMEPTIIKYTNHCGKYFAPFLDKVRKNEITK